MEKSKLLRFIKLLTKKELDRCEDYIKSPIYNKDQKLVELFQIIKSRYPFNQSEQLTKEFIFQECFPNEQKSGAFLRKLQSNLTQLIQGFIIFIARENNIWEPYSTLLSSINERNGNELFKQLAKQIKKQQNKFEYKDLNYYHYNYLIYRTICKYKQTENNRASSTPYSEMFKSLDIFYFISKLQYCIEILSRENIINEPHDVILLHEILETVDHTDFKFIPIINLYCLLIKLLQTENDQYFFLLKQTLEKEETQLPSVELKNAYSIIINYLANQIKHGKILLLKEVFLIYKKMIAKEWLFEDGQLSSPNFKNMITTATRLGEYEWAKQFIDNYKDKLKIADQNSMVSYCLGIIAFYQKEYISVLRHLNQVEHLPDVYYKLNHYTLLIKTCYKLEEYRTLESKLESMRMFLKRNNALPSKKRTPYSHFNNLSKQLYSLIQKKEEAILIKDLRAKTDRAVLKLREKIEATDLLIDKEWLLQQAYALTLFRKD